MKVILDTHVFLWWIVDDPRLSPRARQVLSQPKNELLLSAASGWEMAIKVGLGKLKIPAPIDRFIIDQLNINGISVLPIDLRHALHVAALPKLHRDPFDRLLIAQAQLERIPIVSGDSQIRQYDVEVIW